MRLTLRQDLRTNGHNNRHARSGQVFSAESLRALSGLPRVKQISLDQDQVIQLMIGIHMDLETKRKVKEEHDSVYAYDENHPKVQHDTRLTPTSNVMESVGDYFERKSWPLRTAQTHDEEPQTSEYQGLLSDITVQSSPALRSPIFRESRRPKPSLSYDDDDHQSIPDLMLPKLSYRNLEADQDSPTIDMYSYLQQVEDRTTRKVPLKTIRDRYAAISSLDGETTVTANDRQDVEKRPQRVEEAVPEGDRAHAEKSRQLNLSQASSDGDFVLINTIEPLPHLHSPWAEESMHFPHEGSRFVENISESNISQGSKESCDSHSKISLWHRIPALPRSKKLSVKGPATEPPSAAV